MPLHNEADRFKSKDDPSSRPNRRHTSASVRSLSLLQCGRGAPSRLLEKTWLLDSADRQNAPRATVAAPLMVVETMTVTLSMAVAVVWAIFADPCDMRLCTENCTDFSDDGDEGMRARSRQRGTRGAREIGMHLGARTSSKRDRTAAVALRSNVQDTNTVHGHQQNRIDVIELARRQAAARATALREGQRTQAERDEAMLESRAGKVGHWPIKAPLPHLTTTRAPRAKLQLRFVQMSTSPALPTPPPQLLPPPRPTTTRLRANDGELPTTATKPSSDTNRAPRVMSWSMRRNAFVEAPLAATTQLWDESLVGPMGQR